MRHIDFCKAYLVTQSQRPEKYHVTTILDVPYKGTERRKAPVTTTTTGGNTTGELV